MRTILNFGMSFIMVCLLAAAAPGQKPPQNLLHAVHCLKVNSFLPPSTAKALTFGYLVDKQSYPGKTVIYVVAYSGRAQLNGTVFQVFLTNTDGRESFNIQNNAGFVLSTRDPIGVSFVTPPRGGTWTQEHLASAIRSIERQRRFTIPLAQISGPDPIAECESYTDR